MKSFAILTISAVLLSCGGELSKQQKDRIRQSMQDGQIRRVSPADLTEAGFELGRKIADRFNNDQNLSDLRVIDSVSGTFGVRIFALKEGVKTAEQAMRILEAYSGTEDAGDLKDNIQKIGKDTLLYTRPVRFERPDGSQVFSHAIAVMMPVRMVVREME